MDQKKFNEMLDLYLADYCRDKHFVSELQEQVQGTEKTHLSRLNYVEEQYSSLLQRFNKLKYEFDRNFENGIQY